MSDSTNKIKTKKIIMGPCNMDVIMTWTRAIFVIEKQNLDSERME